jgi:hypothetical protein
MLPAGILHERPHSLWDSRRLWSLADMINLSFGVFWRGLEYLHEELRRARFVVEAGDGNKIIESNTITQIQTKIEMVMRDCAALVPDDTSKACIDLEDFFRLPFNKCYVDLYDRLERFRGDLEHGLKQEYFHHYNRDMVKLIHPIYMEGEWKLILESFPSARREIETGLDCFALDDYSGCIFHMSRIAELGLRSIAAERGVQSVKKSVPLEYAMWSDVFQAIDKELEALRNKPAGPKREAAQSFYNGALSDLRFMQRFRDRTMHFRDQYLKGEAFDSINRTRELMNRMATAGVQEGMSLPIDWGL